MSMSRGEAAPSVQPVALMGRGGRQRGGPWHHWLPGLDLEACSAPPPPPALKLCPPPGGQRVKGGGRRLVSSCKEGWVIWLLLELRRGAAGGFLLPNSPPPPKPLRPRFSRLPVHHPPPTSSVNLFPFFLAALWRYNSRTTHPFKVYNSVVLYVYRVVHSQSISGHFCHPKMKPCTH